MTPEDQILERLEEAFTKAFNNPRNTSMGKVIREVREYEEFKDYNLDSFLKETTIQPGMHNMKDFPFGKEKTQTILIDKARLDELLRQGVSPKAILYDEIIKREQPDTYERQVKLREIVHLFQDGTDRDQNLDEVFFALFYTMHVAEEGIRYMSKGDDPKKIEDIDDTRDHALKSFYMSCGMKNVK